MKRGIPCLKQQALAGVLGEVRRGDVAGVATVAVDARRLWNVDLC